MGKWQSIDKLFDSLHFDREVIVLCVRWYLRYKLSFRDLVEMMSERGLSLAHTTIMRWVKRLTPEFVKRWNRFATAAGQSWRVDETYVKIRPGWQDGRFPAQRKARCGCRQGLLRESDQEPAARPEGDYAGWLCSLASRCARDEGQRLAAQGHEGPILEALKQLDRAGSPQHQV
jgi:hypothetical protein